MKYLVSVIHCLAFPLVDISLSKITGVVLVPQAWNRGLNKKDHWQSLQLPLFDLKWKVNFKSMKKSSKQQRISKEERERTRTWELERQTETEGGWGEEGGHWLIANLLLTPSHLLRSVRSSNVRFSEIAFLEDTAAAGTVSSDFELSMMKGIQKQGLNRTVCAFHDQWYILKWPKRTLGVERVHGKEQSSRKKRQH